MKTFEGMKGENVRKDRKGAKGCEGVGKKGLELVMQLQETYWEIVVR